jgi:hypothetical protein
MRLLDYVLRNAVAAGNFELVTLCVEQGADVNCKIGFFTRILDYAEENSNVYRYLESKGAKKYTIFMESRWDSRGDNLITIK